VPRTSSHRRRGFTLIEGIAAIVILSITVPPMLWSLRAAHRHRTGAVLASRARWLACEKLEDVMADRHGRGYSYLTAANYPAEASISGFPAFSRIVTLTQTSADLVTPGSGYMRVECTVSYSDSGVARSLTISTILTDYSP
jgi:prepilin-type N-terminal cleavage/methylation domain-containing protein